MCDRALKEFTTSEIFLSSETFTMSLSVRDVNLN